MKTQREIHSEAPRETVPMKPEDILTPKQIGRTAASENFVGI
jgi:hypothetical protein